VALVDLYAASEGHEKNFVLVNRPGGYDIHPTNLGHTLIAAEFAKVWQGLEQRGPLAERARSCSASTSSMVR